MSTAIWAEFAPQQTALVGAVDDLSREISRFNSRVKADPELARFEHLAGRLGCVVELLDCLIQPCASELVAAGVDVDEALDAVDRHARSLRRRLNIQRSTDL